MLLQVSWDSSGEVVIATTVKGITDSFGLHNGQHLSSAIKHGIKIN